MRHNIVHKCGVFCRHPIVAFILGSFASEFITYPFLHPLWEHVGTLKSISQFIENWFK